jgi:hypothetical protein
MNRWRDGRAMSQRRDSYAAHTLALFDSDHDLTRRVVPYVRDGIAAGETVIAVVSGDVAAHLRDGLGVDHRDVQWQLPEFSYHSLGPRFDRLRRYLAGQHDAGHRVRLIAENDMPSNPARTAAYLRFEAASNQVPGA